MSDDATYRVVTKNNLLYHIVKKHGAYYVSKSGYGDRGNTKTLEQAVAIIVADSGLEKTP